MTNNSLSARIGVQVTTALVVAVSLIAGGCSAGSGSPSLGAVPTPVASTSAASPQATPSSTGNAHARSGRYPSSMVVLGHSGNTGYNSDPASPGSDAIENSWAIGENPAVNSIYLRLLRLNPALNGHAMSLSEDGTNVEELITQAGQAVSLRPLPELYLISSVDNDIRCDGTDGQNYSVFADKLRTALKTIDAAAPHARIFIASSPVASEENYAAVLAKLDAKEHIAGRGPCDIYDAAGKLQSKHLRYLSAVTARYLEQVVRVCAEFKQYRYDGGAVRRMVIVPSDLTSDYNHLSISGLRKEAKIEWAVLSKDY